MSAVACYLMWGKYMNVEGIDDSVLGRVVYMLTFARY